MPPEAATQPLPAALSAGMLVYGDRSLAVDPRERMAEALEVWRTECRLDGLARHARLVAAFVLLAELAQGLADASAAACLRDEPDPAASHVFGLLRRMASCIVGSWDGGFRARPAGLEAAPLPLPAGAVACREPEGFAFYALYPEAYAAAAHGLPDVPHHVVGLRSIGTGLAAMVASRLRSATLATLRPHGHPFRRVVSPGPTLAKDLLANPASRFAVVDEGPGLSGSSFGAVCDWLGDRGVDAGRITLFTSHGNPPGPHADPRHAARWPLLARRCVGFDDLILRAPRPEHRLETWVSDLLGAPAHLSADLSGGAWRRHLFATEADWPACDTMLERRKYLFDSPDGPLVARFAGLGLTGERKLMAARALHEAGFAPEPLGFAHGFLVERWHPAARPLARADADRPGLLGRIAAYVGFRAGTFPAGAGTGASLVDLAAMAIQNASEALGEDAGRRISCLTGIARRLGGIVSPVETDGRMDPHEWIALPCGRILKTDALDHHAAHDLIGCQDPAWDVAGGSVDFNLSPPASARLRRAAEAAAGRAIHEDLVAFYRTCLIAFRIGLFTMALASHAGQPAEQARLRARLEGYERTLREELAGKGDA